MTQEMLEAIEKGHIKVEKILDGNLYVQSPEGEVFRYDAHTEGGIFVSLTMDSDPVEDAVENFSGGTSGEHGEGETDQTQHLTEEAQALDHIQQGAIQ